MAGFFFEFMSESIKPSDNFPKYKGNEDSLQKAVARYLDAIGSFWFHCPNGGSRHGLEAAKLKQMGVKAGIPDCIIMDSRHGYAGLVIELKVGYNKPAEHQLEVMNKLVDRNWLVLVSWSLDEVVHMIDWYYSKGKLK